MRATSQVSASSKYVMHAFMMGHIDFDTRTKYRQSGWFRCYAGVPQREGFREGGSYHLVLCLDEDQTLLVGSLGRLSFPKGYYVYTGSAMGGLGARVQRHLRHRKRRHWHIDALTAVARVVYVVTFPSRAREECKRHRWVASLPGARVVEGFGATDCSCSGHLVYFEHLPRTLSVMGKGVVEFMPSEGMSGL